MRTDGLVEGIRAGRIPALARAISLVENGRDGFEDVLAALHPHLGRAYRIGLTGPPGAGKSSLVERLVARYRERGLRVGVVAVDPTSPFSGGALLGDRIRMESHTLDPGVFIRSMATRGAHGGLATTTREVCDILDAFGFDRVLIETVGVGQSELAIAGSADTAVLVLVPESGDGVQVLKAGVMEIADVYVVNKADRPDAHRLVQEVEVMLGIRKGQAFRHVPVGHHRRTVGPTERRAPGPTARRADGQPEHWEPPVLTTVATKNEGIEELVNAIEAHYRHLQTSGELAGRRRDRLARHTRDVVDRAVSTFVWQERGGERVLGERLDDLVAGRVSPYHVAATIVADLHKDNGDDP